MVQVIHKIRVGEIFQFHQIIYQCLGVSTQPKPECAPQDTTPGPLHALLLLQPEPQITRSLLRDLLEVSAQLGLQPDNL